MLSYLQYSNKLVETHHRDYLTSTGRRILVCCLIIKPSEGKSRVPFSVGGLQSLIKSLQVVAMRHSSRRMGLFLVYKYQGITGLRKFRDH